MKKHLPLLVAGVCLFCGILIAIEEVLNTNVLVIPAYVILIFSLGASLLLSVGSSLAFLLKKFNNYWESDYPVVLVLLFCAYGFLKTSGELQGLASYTMGIFLGMAIGVVVFKKLSSGFIERAIPIFSFVVVLTCSEFGSVFSDDHLFFQIIMPGVIAFFLGLLLSGIFIKRY